MTDETKPAAESRTPPTCSFCGKTHLEIRHLLVGKHPQAAICNECVAAAADAIWRAATLITFPGGSTDKPEPPK